MYLKILGYSDRVSVYFTPGLTVRIEPYLGPNAPVPQPLLNGFSIGKAYTVVGMHLPSESGECWLGLVNDRDELWWISNRHVRVVSIGSGV